MKAICECTREERLERALMAIEALTYMFDEGGIDAKQFSSDAYMIAHSSPGRCGNPHEDWLKKIEQIEASAKSMNLYDPEKVLARLHLKESGDAGQQILQ